MLNQQLVLPGISLDELKPIENAEFTFGIEIEVVKFNAGKAINANSGMIIENTRTGIRYIAITKGTSVRNGNEWIHRDHEITVSSISSVSTARKFGCKFQSPDYFRLPKEVQNEWESGEVPVIELHSDGSLPPEWTEVPDTRYWENGRVDLEGSALHQATALLHKNRLGMWKTTFDGSITDSKFDGIELTSPVFRYGRMNSIQEACNLFQTRVETDESCGLHIHAGIKNKKFTLDQLKLLVLKWLEIESSLLRLPFYKQGCRQNWPLTTCTDIAKVLKATNRFELTMAVSEYERNVYLNLLSLEDHGTFEFRGFESTLDPDRIRMLVRFCVEFVKRVLC